MSDVVEPNDDTDPDEDERNYRPTRGVLSQEDYEGASDDDEEDE